MTQRAFPKDLAQVLHDRIHTLSSAPSHRVLVELFEVMYFASLKSEEAQPIICYVAYLDPKSVLKQSPEPHKAHWSVIQLGQSLPLTVPNLVKIAKASDPRTSSFAVFYDDEQGLFVWGLVDQGNRYNDYINYDLEDLGGKKPARPGIFQASILGVGHLVAFIEYEKIAELKVNALLRGTINALREGNIRDALSLGIEQYLAEVTRSLPKYVRSHVLSEAWMYELDSIWIDTLGRLIRRIQSFRHGGALLITPDSALNFLDIKYGIHYARLTPALVTNALATVRHSASRYRLGQEYGPNSAYENITQMIMASHLEILSSEESFRESRQEIDGALWFIALLSRVDGLVVMSPNLEVRGFGTIIRDTPAPNLVYMSPDPVAHPSRLQPIRSDHFGTRHRSVMGYCYHVPDSVGCVVSQDGDIRVMKRIGEQLIVWENVRLQYESESIARVKASPQTNQQSRRVTIKLPQEVYDSLAALAAERGITRSQWLLKEFSEIARLNE